MADDDVSLFGRIREKLVGQKQQWARDGRLLTGEIADPLADRLPPGQRLVKDWPVLDLGVQPAVAREKATLTLDGAVANPVTLDWPTLMNLPQTDRVCDIHCVTQWSRYDNRFTGIAARTIMDLCRPAPEARHVIFHAWDGYTTNVTLEHFDQEDVLLAHAWEGHPLTRQHGAPLRVVMPRWYFWKSAKWVKRLEFTAQDRPGFWEVRGYHNQGDPWTEERYG